MSTTLSIILDTRRIKKSNKYPVKLRVTFERVTEYYQTIFDLTKDEYDKLSASRISNELQTIRDKLKEIERTAENAVKDLGSFSFTDFENVILGKPSVFNDAELSFDLKPDSVKVSAQQSSINYIFSFLRSNFVLGQSRFIANSNGSLVDANIFYNNYQTINGINFSADRDIAVTGTAPMKLELNFKEYNFNQPQTFPFTISKNYSVRYD